MLSSLHRPQVRSLFFLLSVLLVVLTGCGGAATGAGGGSGNSNVTIVVGSKDDTEAQLLGAMYAIVLQHAGFHVQQKLKLGGNAIVTSAITSGAIDLYPEFTATGLAKLGLKTSHNVQTDYQTVKAGYLHK
jgi:osmoprotectant transport system substrate-binding protein